MRRFLALATLLVLSLSRFGAAAPAHVHVLAWATDSTPQEMLGSVPSVRLTTLRARELGPSVPVRAHTPWTPADIADVLRSSFQRARHELTATSTERSAPSAWHRFPYYPTAPPRLS